MLYVTLDMLDIFCVALFQCAASLAHAPTIYVVLKLGEIGHSDAAWPGKQTVKLVTH